MDTLQKIRSFAQKYKIDYEETVDGYYFTEGSSQIYVMVEKVGPLQFDVISFYSLVVMNANLTDELKTKLLRANTTMPFGAFGLSESGDIYYRYTILGGNHVDYEEWRNAVTEVALIADEYDDKIIAAYGGSTPLDEAIRIQKEIEEKIKQTTFFDEEAG